MKNIQRLFNLTDSEYLHYRIMQVLTDLPKLQILITIRQEADCRLQRLNRIKSFLLK